MWIVRLALRRPYTFVVLALLNRRPGCGRDRDHARRHLPAINIPVVNVIWSYSGLSPTEMQDRIVSISERAFTTTVSGIEHIESVSLRGVAVTRLYFHPNVPIEAAIAQINAQAQQDRPPAAARHLSAAHHPVQRGERAGGAGQPQQRAAARAASSTTTATISIRTQLVTVAGRRRAGALRRARSGWSTVDIDPDALYARACRLRT